MSVEAEIELFVDDGELIIRFVDAGSGLWDFPIDLFDPEDPSAMRDWVESEIRDNAWELADSLVRTLIRQQKEQT